MSNFDYSSIPHDMRKFSQWVVWNKFPKKNNPDKFDKIPVKPGTQNHLPGFTAGRGLMSFEDEVEAYQRGGHSGIGFVFTQHDPFGFIDIDNALDPRSGEWSDFAASAYSMLRSWSELSVSGTGMHIIARGELRGGVTSPQIEVYGTGRFCALTGSILQGGLE